MQKLTVLQKDEIVVAKCLKNYKEINFVIHRHQNIKEYHIGIKKEK